MVDIQVTGGEQFHALARRLREAADGGLERELSRGLDRSTRKLDEAVRVSALDNLPQRGGLAELVARSRIVSEKLTPLRLRIVAKGISQLALINKGHVNRPTYGRRPWHFQSIPRARNWFDRPLRRGAPKVRRELEKAMDRTARRITRG